VSNDAEAHYHLGLAEAALGNLRDARAHWERALHDRTFRPPARLQIARALASQGDTEGARARVRSALDEAPSMVRAGAFEVILLRRQGRKAEASERLARWQEVDPTSSTLRNERVLLEGADDGLWLHLAGDPQRVLEAALDYMALAAWDDALALLAREYPTGAGVHSEPGMPAPQRHPEVVYYRGYCREKLGQPARADYEAASRLGTTYVFPQRAESLPVLQQAAEANPGDATARFLLGSLYLSGGIADRAVEEWEAARRLDPAIPVLHRNLGLTLLHALREPERARQVLDEGRKFDPENVEVYLALDQVLGLLGRPPAERVAALEAYPRRDALPGALVFKLALALIEAGRSAEAERLFPGRFFPREEFGTNVRQVFVEVELQMAIGLAKTRDCGEARRIVEGLGREVPGLAFTKDGMAPFVEAARAQYLIGELFERCGDPAEARRRFERAAAATDSYPHPQIAYALKAAEKLGDGRADAVRPRVETALASWTNRLAVGTNFPGPNAAGQGLMLQALGRPREAEVKLREALLLSDKVLSHYLSRRALAGEGGE
jgi:tetratricopeptide (TPR) repeat protein